MLVRVHAGVADVPAKIRGEPSKNGNEINQMALASELIVGSPGRIRTYNPSVNSRNGFSRLTLQTQLFRRAKTGFSRKWGGLWGIDAADGAHLWSERYDREMSDIFTLLAVR